MGLHEVVTTSLPYDGGRTVTAYVPPAPPQAVVHCADGGWHGERLLAALEAAGDEVPPVLLVGIHGLDTDDGRFGEYVPVVDPPRFEAHERFFVDQVGAWLRSALDVSLGPERTAVWGASLGGECALAMGVRHPDVYGTVFCASPGGGYRPTDGMDLASLRCYLVAGDQEPFFVENAERWRDAIAQADGDAVMHVRPGDHGGTFWFGELPAMVTWMVAG